MNATQRRFFSSSGATDDIRLRFGHAFWVKRFVQRLRIEQLSLGGDFTNRLAGLEAFLGDVGGFVVADRAGPGSYTSPGSARPSASQRSRLASMPATQRSAKTRAALASSSIDCSRLYAITGIMTFSSNVLPNARWRRRRSSRRCRSPGPRPAAPSRSSPD